MATRLGHTRRRGTNRPRRVGLLAAVLAVAAACPADASGAPPVPRAPTRLAGTTVFAASRAGAAVVRLARPASLVVDNQATSPDVDISAPAGRLAGFVLTAVKRPEREPYTLTLLRVGFCAQPRCRTTATSGAGEYVATSSGFAERDLTPKTRRVTLPAGDYTVRAVTDGAPVRLTLRLTGLTGTARVGVTAPSRPVLRTDSSPPGTAGVDPLRNVGVPHTFHGDLGLMMHVILTEYEPHVRSQAGVCTYLDDNKPPTGRYHPACPSAEGETTFDRTYPTLRHATAGYGSDIALREGRWTRGFFLSGVGGKSSLTVVTLWVDLA